MIHVLTEIKYNFQNELLLCYTQEFIDILGYLIIININWVLHLFYRKNVGILLNKQLLNYLCAY